MKKASIFAMFLFTSMITGSCTRDDQTPAEAQTKPFNIMETTIGDIQAEYKAGRLTSHQVVQMYLDRIEAYDQKGPAINSIITLNKNALAEADKLDAAFKQNGSFVGPLHGIPIIL